MHRARTFAQHEGSLPAAGHLARWVNDTERFLTDLVSRVFKVHLSEVHQANRVVNPMLRELDTLRELLHRPRWWERAKCPAQLDVRCLSPR